ncbi:Importin-11 [Terramyces sp. JEL0728]|nr:Importin-11 [Terramyces sp. JEL0728]
MSSVELCNILQQATSLDTVKRTEALKILENWEMAPMYHATLQQIYLDSNLDIKIRSLAVISLKNGIDKYWRKSAKGAIQPQEKQLIKQNQIQFLGESNRQLATQHAVIVAKIARHDFPNEWITQMITPNVYRFTSTVFHSQLAKFFNLVEQNSTDITELNDTLVLAKVSLKCLRRLTINGYQRFSEASEVTELFSSLNGYLPKLQTIYDPLYENIKIQALKMLKNIVRHPAYHVVSEKHADPKVPEALNILHGILTQEFVINCSKTLLSRYICLSKTDLELWEDDPESFNQEEESDHWEFSLRVQNKAPEFKVLRRRIADLIGHWVGVKSAKEKRSVLYEAIISLLVPGEDIVVRLRATSNLLKLIDDFDFDPAQFVPYLPTVIENFKDLLDAVDEFDSKITIINCLIAITERLEGQAIVAMGPLFSVIHSLWLRSEGQNMFRTSIVKILTKFVKTLRGESYQMYEMVAPILQESLDTSNPGHVYLFEEGLELWLATMQNCARPHQGLLNLVPIAVGLLELGTETLKKVIHILEAYIVVCPQEVFQSYITPIISTVCRILENVSAPAVSALLKMVDLVLQSANNTNCTAALFNVIYSTGFFNKAVSVVLMGEDLSVVIIAFMMVLARMVLYDPNSVIRTLESGGQDIVDRLSIAMIEKFDALSHVRQSKLFSLAFASLVSTGHPKVAARLGEFFSIFTSVAIQLKDLDRTEAQLFSFEARNEDDDEFSLDYERRKYLNSLDPLYMEGSFVPYVKTKLGEFEQKVGTAYLNELTRKIDQDIMLQINRMFQ